MEEDRNRLNPTVRVLAATLCASLLLGASSAIALDQGGDKSASSTKVDMTLPSKTILGQDYRYPSGVPLIEAFTIEVPPGAQVPLHKHAVPMYVYMVAGELEVDYGSKGKRTFKAGNSFVEALHWCHSGRSLGKETVKLLAVYLSQEAPNQVTSEPCERPE